MSSEHVRIGGIEHKVCCRCRRTLPLLHFYSSCRSSDGLRPRCRECEHEDNMRRELLKRRATRLDRLRSPLRTIRSWITKTSKA